MNLLEKKLRLDYQVLGALLGAGVGAGFYADALRGIVAAHLGAAPDVADPRWLRVLAPAAFYGAALWWARPLARYLDGRNEALRPLALKRYLGLFRFLCGLWGAVLALGVLTRVAWSSGRGSAYWAAWLAHDTALVYYGAYFTTAILEAYLIKNVSPLLYAAPELYARKGGPFWTIHAKLILFVVNLVLLPLLLIELGRQAGIGRDAMVGVIATTFVAAASYIEILYRSISRPLIELNKKMERLAAGDYSCKTSVLDDDEIGELKAHFNSMVDGLAERERLKETFGRYVSVEVAKKLLERGGATLGGERIEATILFSDIRDFTSMSERMSPEELVRFLNDYFSCVTEPIMAQRGMVNKFIGDAVMAVFAPQFGSREHVDDAVRAALGMRERLAAFNAEGRGPGGVRFGVGVHTGLLVAGNIGTEKRLEYTVIGDTVNIASRIEGMNKELDSVILLSGDVSERLSPALRASLSLERREKVRLKGKERPVELYRLD